MYIGCCFRIGSYSFITSSRGGVGVFGIDQNIVLLIRGGREGVQKGPKSYDVIHEEPLIHGKV